MVIRTAFSNSGVENTSRFLESCQWISLILALLASLSPGCEAQTLNEVFLPMVKHSHALFNACFSSSRSVISREILACNLNRLSSAGVLPSKQTIGHR
jgi:hypothetical protein